MVQKIKNAVEEITGIDFDQFTGPTQKRDRYFARLIFAYCLMNHAGLNYKIVARIIKRDSSTVFRYSGFYLNEIKYNPDFRKLARLTEEKLISVSV